MRRAELVEAMLDIRRVYRLTTNFSFYRHGPRATIECVAHELGHWFALRGGMEISYLLDSLVQDEMEWRPIYAANRQEGMACAIEHEGLKALGFKIDTRRLLGAAARMLHGNDHTLRHMKQLFNDAMNTKWVHTGASRFVRAVEAHAR